MNGKSAGWGFLLVILTVAVFIPVLRGDFLHWDDLSLYVENLSYRGWSPAHLKWMCTTFLLGHWQPLSWMSCALDYTIWGMNPAGWHATNLLIHAMNAALVYLLCLAFIPPQRPARRVAAALAALFWAVHPLRVEAVAWLATRGYLLGTTFCLLTVLFYLKEVGTVRRTVHGRLGEASLPNNYPFTALLCFTLATVTKGIGMMLPPVLILIDWYEAKRRGEGAWREILGRKLVEKIPFFILSFLTGVMAFWSKSARGGMATIEQYGLVDRAGQAIYGIWFYLLKTVAPAQLSPVYSARPADGLVMVSLVLTATVFIFLFLFRRRLFPIIGTLGAFLLLIFPMLGITQSGPQMVADRFTYLAAIPFSILMAAGLVRLTAMRRIVSGAVGVLLVIFSIQTIIWAGVWSDSLAFWHLSAAVEGANARAYNGIGVVLMERGKYEKALNYFDGAIMLDAGFSAAHHNRATILAALGRYEESIEGFTKVLAFPGLKDVDRAKIRIGRAWVLERTGRLDEALQDYNQVLLLPVDTVWRQRAGDAIQALKK